MKKLLFVIITLAAFGAEAQLKVGIDLGAPVYYAQRGALRFVPKPQLDLSTSYNAHIAYDVKYYLQPMLMVSYTSVNTSNSFDRKNTTFMLGSRGAFLKSRFSPIYQVGIGFTYSDVSDIPDFDVTNSKTAAPVFNYGLGAKISIYPKIDLNFLVSDHISHDILIIGDQKYRYVLCTVGAAWKLGRK